MRILADAAPANKETAVSVSQADTGSATETAASASIPVPKTGVTNHEEEATFSISIENKTQSSVVAEKMVDDSTATITNNTEATINIVLATPVNNSDDNEKEEIDDDLDTKIPALHANSNDKDNVSEITKDKDPVNNYPSIDIMSLFEDKVLIEKHFKIMKMLQRN